MSEYGMNCARQNLLEIGAEFCGYRVVRLLGKGAIGEVYLVKQENLDSFYIPNLPLPIHKNISQLYPSL